jgi:hypothetical protein
VRRLAAAFLPSSTPTTLFVVPANSTLLVVTPTLTAGPQQITITNADCESVSIDAALIAN